MKKPLRLLGALAAVLGLAGAPALAGADKTALDRPATMSAKASRSLLLDVTDAGKRLVAVGERGHIVYSDDGGKTWQQAKVPVSVLLAGVYFATDKLGWAVGHDGVILHSADGGASWTLQHSDREETAEGKEAAPLLDVWFTSESTGFAVGAYGYFLKTTDGGRTWTDNSAALNNPDGWHLNAITGVPGTDTLFVAGEQGKLFRSVDGGESWVSLPSPFDGSFFGVSAPGADLVLVYGLQGRLFASTDLGRTWRQVQTGVTSGINGAVRLTDGRVFIVGNAGVVLAAADNRLELLPQVLSDRRSLAAALPLSTSALLVVGEGGARVLPVGGR